VNPETFDAAQPLLDKITELAEKQLASEELRRIMAEPGNLVGKGRIASVNIVVDVLDEDKERSIPLLTTGLSAFHGKEPFRCWGDWLCSFSHFLEAILLRYRAFRCRALGFATHSATTTYSS
jgi:hypothetical protein